jgi:chromosome segregation ATPase
VEHLEKLKLDLETELKGYMDDNHVLKRDLDLALNAKIEAEVSLKEEKEKLLGALSEADCALSERKSELEITLHQQKQALEHLEKLRVDMETELKGYVDDNHVLKRDLDAALIAKMEAEEIHEEEKRTLLFALDEANCALSERKNELDQLKQALENLEKLNVDMQVEVNSYKEENCALKRDLDAALFAREEKEKLSSMIDERERNIVELQQYINVLEEDNLGQKLDVASLIKSEVQKSIRDVNNRYSEIVEIFDKKLLELETRLGFFEQKYTCREHEIMEIFDQEEADWYTLIAEKENAIADIQLIVESVQLNIKHLLEAAASKLTEVQVEVQQLYGFAENLNTLNIVQEHDSFFKDTLIAECERELEDLQIKLVLEREQSSNLKHVLEKLKAETTAEMLEKAKEHLEIVNKLKFAEERKEILEEHLGQLTSRTKDMLNVVDQERKELVDELNGITYTIGAAIHGDDDLMASLRRIMQKANIEEPPLNSSSKEIPSLEKQQMRNHGPLTKNKSASLTDRRSPLKENNY